MPPTDPKINGRCPDRLLARQRRGDPPDHHRLLHRPADLGIGLPNDSRAKVCDLPNSRRIERATRSGLRSDGHGLRLPSLLRIGVNGLLEVVGLMCWQIARCAVLRGRERNRA